MLHLGVLEKRKQDAGLFFGRCWAGPVGGNGIMRALVFERFPHSRRALADAFLGHKFARKRREDVVVLFHSRQAVIGQFPFEREGDSIFFPMSRRQRSWVVSA